MNPGKLDRLITLLAPQHVRSGAGDSVPTFVPYATDLPAEQINPTTGQVLIANTQQGQQRNVFRVRYRDDVRSGHRLLFEGRTFAVVSWGEDPKQPRRAYLLIGAEETVPAPPVVIAP